jgi:UDP-hydrolysing UDP-N-acetyl-D-glucosamine 2-epimerase
MRRICAFSGKRGGFGAYLPLLRLAEVDPDLELLVLLGDQHGSAEFGNTADEVHAQLPDAAVELIEMGTGRGDTPLVRVENLAACLAAAGSILERVRPEVVLVHGDRGEHLMVAFAAANLGVAVAHTQGGDRSGNIDELQRHAISKLAHLHFPESESAAERLRRMGEEEWRICTVGSTYVDRIVGGHFVAPDEARGRLGLAPGEAFLLVLVHPETFLSRDDNEHVARAVLSAVRATGLRAIVTYPCSDPGYEGVLAALAELDGDTQFVIRKNIDNDVYLGLLAGAVALVGNSSAALVEAPYLHLPCVNVGERQAGRERDANVIDADATREGVLAALATARAPEFRASLETLPLRLGDGHAAERILDVLRSTPLDGRLLRKQIVY